MASELRICYKKDHTTLEYSNLACARKQGTLSHLLHPWTGMYIVLPLAETDFVTDFQTLNLSFTFYTF